MLLLTPIQHLTLGPSPVPLPLILMPNPAVLAVPLELWEAVGIVWAKADRVRVGTGAD